MKRLTNQSDVPLSVAVWLASDSYGFKFNDKALSATDMGKSVRQLILRNRLREAGTTIIVEEDITRRIASRMGHAIHDSIEQVWRDPIKRNIGLEQLGIPQQVRDRIVIDPTEEFLEKNPKAIPVYMEVRTNKQINGYTISGQFDFLAEGQLEDFKSAGTYVFEKGVNDDKFALQGSIYRWLNPDKIKKDTTRINYLFKDWSENKAKASPKYPQSPVTAVEIKLMTPAETEQFIITKTNHLDAHKDTPEPELPFCTAEELWQGEPEYKYFAKAESTRASKVFGNDASAAYQHLASKGGRGIIKEIPAKAKACHYCDAFQVCSQAQQLLETGVLEPK